MSSVRQKSSSSGARTEELEGQVSALNCEVSKLKSKLKTLNSELESTKAENQSLKCVAESRSLGLWVMAHPSQPCHCPVAVLTQRSMD